MTFLEWCIENARPDMLGEWYGKTSPSEYSYGSTKKVKWRCQFGHIWEESLNKRTANGGSKCPYCANRKVWKGFNDLASQRPELLIEWDYSLNTVNPDEIYVGSSKKVGWICSKGHRWDAAIKDRTKKKSTGCPICSNNRTSTGYNDLKTVYPDLEKEYSEKNEVPSDMIYCKSTKSALWICSRGHEYKARVVDRVSGNGCPYCAGKKLLFGFNDLASQFPEVAKEWDYDKNKGKPEEMLQGSTKRVWWKCHKNHSWSQIVYVRTKQGTGCPYCAGELAIPGENDIQTLAPWLVDEWDFALNGELVPTNVMVHSGKKIHWICPLGHKYIASPNERMTGRGCTQCDKENHTSFPEQAIFFYFSQLFKDAENRCIIDGYEFDIYIPDIKMAIEYDGIYFHRGDAAKERERRKNAYCKAHGITLYRVKEVEQDTKSKQNIFYRHLPDNGMNLDRIITELLKIAIENSGNSSRTYKVDTTADRFSIRSRYIVALKERSIERLYPELAKEWDYSKNGGISPSSVTVGSHEKVWWVCPKGHSYEAAVHKRTNEGTGCPYCANKKVLAGFNDLKTVRPELAKEWDVMKNEGISPSQVTQYSNKKVWWICPKKHSYLAQISKRSTGRSCPYCSNKKVLKGYNDLLTTNPAQALDWDYEANTIKPDEITKGYTKKVHWVCHKCGHKWYESPYMTVYRMRGCPECRKKVDTD